MTSRAETIVYVDAATVYAEGVLAGLRSACNIIGRHDSRKLTARQRRFLVKVFGHAEFGVVPPELERLVTAYRSIAIHNDWLARRGTPAECPLLPDRAALIARIDAFLQLFPEQSHDD
jgi:hypothetical protein